MQTELCRFPVWLWYCRCDAFMDLGCHGIAFCRLVPRSTLRTPDSKKHAIRANTRKLSSPFSVLAALLLPALLSGGDTECCRHIVFDNSLTSDNYFYSYAQASSPSLIEQKRWQAAGRDQVVHHATQCSA